MGNIGRERACKRARARCVAAQRAADGGADSNNQPAVEDGDRLVDQEDLGNRAAAIEESGCIHERREERFERRS